MLLSYYLWVVDLLGHHLWLWDQRISLFSDMLQTQQAIDGSIKKIVNIFKGITKKGARRGTHLFFKLEYLICFILKSAISNVHALLFVCLCLSCLCMFINDCTRCPQRRGSRGGRGGSRWEVGGVGGGGGGWAEAIRDYCYWQGCTLMG